MTTIQKNGVNSWLSDEQLSANRSKYALLWCFEYINLKRGVENVRIDYQLIEYSGIKPEDWLTSLEVPKEFWPKDRGVIDDKSDEGLIAAIVLAAAFREEVYEFQHGVDHL